MKKILNYIKIKKGTVILYDDKIGNNQFIFDSLFYHLLIDLVENILNHIEYINSFSSRDNTISLNNHINDIDHNNNNNFLFIIMIILHSMILIIILI